MDKKFQILTGQFELLRQNSTYITTFRVITQHFELEHAISSNTNFRVITGNFDR